MDISKRAAGILQYLKGAESFTRWRCEISVCPLCGKTMFLALAADPFFVRCIRCRANVTSLAIAKTVQLNVPNLQTKHAYEMSTYGASYEFLKRFCSSFDSSEYFPDRSPGEIVDGVRNEDAQRLSFSDESIDLVTSNQVFEHVPDDLQAFQECYRVLKPGGQLIFTVPFYNAPRTEAVAKIEDGAIYWFSQPEYHSSRTTGPNSVPVFWRFSLNDILERVLEAGFSSARLMSISLCSIQGPPQPVVFAIKS